MAPYDQFNYNFNINKTVPKKKKERLLISVTSTIWGNLLFKLEKMLEKLKDRSLPELLMDIKYVTDLYRTAYNQFPTGGDGFKCNMYLLYYMAVANLMVYQF